MAKLELWVGMTNWLSEYLPYYAKLVEPLQSGKTSLLKDAPKEGGVARKNYVAGKAVVPTPEERAAFEKIRQVFVMGSFLVHYGNTQCLYLDVDASKKVGIGIMLYHFKVCFTDHAATVAIVKQKSLTTSSANILNLRLIRASQYLSQFKLKVVHKPGIIHVVPDALSHFRTSIQERTSRDI